MGRRAAASLFVLAAGCAAGGACASAAGSGAVIRAGTWGGEHAVLVADASGASLQFDCAHGAIEERPALGPGGAFDLAGNFVREHGGPIRRNEVEDRRPARYAGRISGKTMTITVEIPGEPAVGPFTLELGNPGRIVRCR